MGLPIPYWHITQVFKIITKLDTPHANNIVEACHKRYKNEILPIKHFETFEDLVKDLPNYKENYNNMPHSFLQGQTPNETSLGIIFDKELYFTEIRRNKTARQAANKARFCCKV